MGKIYISIGISCTISLYLRNIHKRHFSLPFDWVMTYNGVYNIISSNFVNYLPNKNGTKLLNKNSHSLFLHNTFPDDYDKMNRRIQRFMELLNNNSDELIFIRKGHLNKHHYEVKKCKCRLKNDIVDCHQLYHYLKKNYPQLKFRIILFLGCKKCFKKKHHSKFITIYNLTYFKKNNKQNIDKQIHKILDKIILTPTYKYAMNIVDNIIDKVITSIITCNHVQPSL